MSSLRQLTDLLRSTSGAIDALAVDPKAKTKLVVSLSERFPEVWTQYGGRRRVSLVRPGRFLRDRFGVDVTVGRGLIFIGLMPSSVQRITAEVVASCWNIDAATALQLRPTRGLRDNLWRIYELTGCPIFIVSALWRFQGNADVMWQALRDEAERVRQQLKQGGGE